MKSNQGPPAGGPFFFGQSNHAGLERDVLFDLLVRCRRRLRLARLVRELSFAACWLCGALLAHRLLQAFVSATPVVESLTALSIVVSCIAAAIHLGRALPGYSLARTAGLIDSRAQLADELKTAHWLLGQKAGAPMARMQIERARDTGRQLDPARVVPISVPASAAVAAAFLLAAVVLPLAPRQFDSPTASTHAIDTSSSASTLAKSPVQTMPRFNLEHEWAELEQAVRHMGDHADSDALVAAIRSRDAGLVAELLKQLQHGMPAAQPATRAASDDPTIGEDHRPAIVVPPDEADRVRPPPQALIEVKGADIARAVAMAQALSEQTQMAPSSPTAEQPPSSAGTGPSGDGAMPIDGERDGARPGADSFAGSSSSEGDASADAKSAGGEEGVASGEAGDARGTARASLDEDTQSLPLLGERTMRLRTQLERVRIEAAGQPDSAGIQDRVYAPTSEQLSGLAYETVTPSGRYAAAGAVAREDVPLIYREVVKDYFLKLTQEED
ncbi:MAG: hypothetical protein KIS79_09545 [Burkholderiales bacterium]|nr:hypothetical protein [Burkholderiales bacterium]